MPEQTKCECESKMKNVLRYCDKKKFKETPKDKYFISQKKATKIKKT